MSKCLIYQDPEHQCSEYPVKCDNCHCQSSNWKEEGAYVCQGTVPPLMWHRAKVGHSFGKDTVVLYDGDPDARMVRCAVNDCLYISVDELKKLPVEDE